MNQHWLYYSIYTQPTNLIVIGGWRGATGKKYFCRHDQMPTKCEHHQSSRKPQKDDVQRRQHQIYSAVQFSFKYKFIPCGHTNSNLSQLRDNKPQSEDFSSLNYLFRRRGDAILFPASCSWRLAGQIVEHPRDAWYSSNLAHLKRSCIFFLQKWLWIN